MKPRTKNQKEVDKLIHLTGCPSLEQEKWGNKAAFDSVAFSTTRTRWCSECGTVHLVADVPEKKGYVVCPHCGMKLKIVKSSCRKNSETAYYGTLSTVKDWQVLRLFLVFKTMRKNESAVFCQFEVGQRWMKPGAANIIYERPLRGIGCWYGSHPFDLSRGLILKDEPRVRIGDIPIYTKKSILKEYKKRGVTGNFHSLSPIDVFTNVGNDSKAETLWKAGEYDMFRQFYCQVTNDIEKYWPSIKICLRNKYKVKDVSSWIDYLDALKSLGLDLRNAHYVCPENFAEAHERIIDRKAKKELAKEMNALSEKNVKYQSRIMKFRDMNITDGKICLVVLPSISEFKKEGDYLHHCVYKMKYYDKKSSLIMSARIDGQRIETIEVSLKDYSVLQCHGNHNQPSEYHDEIMRLVNGNMQVIKKFNSGKVRARA